METKKIAMAVIGVVVFAAIVLGLKFYRDGQNPIVGQVGQQQVVQQQGAQTQSVPSPMADPYATYSAPAPQQ